MQNSSKYLHEIINTILNNLSSEFVKYELMGNKIKAGLIEKDDCAFSDISFSVGFAAINNIGADLLNIKYLRASDDFQVNLCKSNEDNIIQTFNNIGASQLRDKVIEGLFSNKFQLN